MAYCMMKLCSLVIKKFQSGKLLGLQRRVISIDWKTVYQRNFKIAVAGSENEEIFKIRRVSSKLRNKMFFNGRMIIAFNFFSQ